MECQKTPKTVLKSQWNNFLLKKFKIGSKPFKEGSSRTTPQNFKILMDIWWWSCPSNKRRKLPKTSQMELRSTMNGIQKIQKWQVYSFLISADFFFCLLFSCFVWTFFVGATFSFYVVSTHIVVAFPFCSFTAFHSSFVLTSAFKIV